LYNLGLEPYSIQKVIGSEWIRQLKEMNSVHPYHKEEQFEKYEHFIFFFHDTCFEVVGEGYSIDENSESNNSTNWKTNMVRLLSTAHY